MTPQKFKPGDKVGIVDPQAVGVRHYSEYGEFRKLPSVLEPNKEYVVAYYIGWEPIYNVWAVKLVGERIPVAETILAPLLPADALAELLEETLLQPVNQ